MRRVSYLSEEKIEEAGFRAGKAAEVAQKIGRVLSKRLMTKIGVSPVPEKIVMEERNLMDI